VSLYVCSNPECFAVENTALGAWHGRTLEGLPVLCSECGKGAWHGRFPKERYDPAKHDEYDVYLRKQAERVGWTPEPLRPDAEPEQAP
jgi:hypothetical protein